MKRPIENMHHKDHCIFSIYTYLFCYVKLKYYWLSATYMCEMFSCPVQEKVAPIFSFGYDLTENLNNFPVSQLEHQAVMIML